MSEDTSELEKQYTQLFQKAVESFEKGYYKDAMITFAALHDNGYNKSQIFDLLINAYYMPNLELLKSTYYKNINLLNKYIYLFKRDFLAFEELTIKLFPIDHNMYIEYFENEKCFGNIYNNNASENKDYVREIYKSYILKNELNLNNIMKLSNKIVKSETLKEDNHIYLYYDNFNVFCSYLQVLDLEILLKDKKVIFIFGEEELNKYYPLDFNNFFGIDYRNMSEELIESIEIFKSSELNMNFEELFNEARKEFEFHNYSNSILRFAALVNNNYNVNNILNIISECYYNPNKEELINQYNKNIKIFKKYPYVMKKDFLDFDKLPLKLYPISDNLYLVYNDINKCFSNIYNSESLKEEKHFFKDLSKQLIVKDEFNINNIKYLYDNIRKSEDYGEDNHIYLYYSEFNVFCSYIQLMDFENLLEDEKLVFIFGEEQLEHYYPINFKDMFNIDYSCIEAKPVSIHEINRLIIGWPTGGLSGSIFLGNIIDFHPQMLTIKEFGLSGFGIVYDKILKNNTVAKFLNGFSTLINLPQNEDVLKEMQKIFKYMGISYISNNSNVSNNIRVPKIGDFFYYLQNILSGIEVPTKLEWFKGFYLAYSYALDRNLNSRISPAIFFHPHDSLNLPAKKCIDAMYDVFDLFKYFKAVSIIRNITTVLGSTINTYNENNHIYVANMILESEALYGCKQDKYYDKRAVVRFEDLKINPKATLLNLCEFIDIPWNNTLLQTTNNGGMNGYDLGGTEVIGYDITPVYKLYQQYLSFFDKYRIEIVKSKYYEPYGYKAKFYDGYQHSLLDILKMFEMPFKFEECHISQAQISQNNLAREKLYRTVLKLIEEPIPTKDGIPMIPIKWLKPKEDLIEVPLYE